jgi:hypothetical protein
VDATVFIQQLEGLINEFFALKNRSKYDDCSDVIKETNGTDLATRAYAAIERISGPASFYSRKGRMIIEQHHSGRSQIIHLAGVLQSLLSDIKAGYLRSVEEIVHGELFGDFLEMARHLTESGYKDAAAVIAGSSLEAHLRQLAKRAGISTENSDGAPKKADLLNAELTKAGVYSGLDQKNVTAWLDLRNKAAHGRYGEYSKEQVPLLIDSIQNFMTRYPA